VDRAVAPPRQPYIAKRWDCGSPETGASQINQGPFLNLSRCIVVTIRLAVVPQRATRLFLTNVAQANETDNIATNSTKTIRPLTFSAGFSKRRSIEANST